jgi:tetratricopeptide (TPR) repeat protein
MKHIIIGVVGIMVLMTMGCSATISASPTQTPEPVIKETALQWFERGNAYVQAGNYEDAVKAFTLAIASEPNFADAYYSRGLVLGRSGKHEQAIDDFTQAIALDQKNANVYADRGAAYGLLGQHAKAISDFTQAIVLSPNFAGAYYNRAIGYFAENKCNEARKDVRKSQELGYQNTQPRFLIELAKKCPENQ